MNRFFGDTSYFIALMMKQESAHVQAMKLTATLRDIIITSEWIFAEVGNYLSGMPHRAGFCRYVDQLRSDSSFEILPANSADFEAGLTLYRNRSDKNWSFIDCISITQISRYGITEVLSADHHFRQAGFRILLDA